MPELLVAFITTLDGYGAAEGWPGWWGLEGPEYLAWLGDQQEADHTVLMGANTYRVMSGFAAEGEPELGQFALARGQFFRAVFALAVQIAPKLVAFVDPRLQRRLQRFALLIECRAKLVERRFVRGGFGRAFITLPAEGLAKHGKLRLPRLQRSAEQKDRTPSLCCRSRQTPNQIRARHALGQRCTLQVTCPDERHSIG